MAPSSHLSTRELEIFQKAFMSFRDPGAMKMDYGKLAELAGFSSAKSACAAWNVVKKKILAGTPLAEGVNSKVDKPTSSKTEATPSKRAPKASAETEVEDEASAHHEKTCAESSENKAVGECKTTAVEPVTPGGEVVDKNDVTTEASATKVEPAKSSTKKAPRKRKVAPVDPGTPGGGDVADDEGTNKTNASEATPAKKKRTVTRKPKDPNAPPPKRRVKKSTQADTTSASLNADEKANAQLLEEARNDPRAKEEFSLFGPVVKAQTNVEDHSVTGEERFDKEGDDKLFGVDRAADNDSDKAA